MKPLTYFDFSGAPVRFGDVGYFDDCKTSPDESENAFLAVRRVYCNYTENCNNFGTFVLK
jgi:hypothetical protein